MTPTPEDFTKAVAAMASIIPFFPKDGETKIIIASLLQRFVGTVEELDWLTLTACGFIRDWERGGGVNELRGLFCTKYNPADGVTAHCTTPGFRAADFEARFFQREQADNERRLAEYKQKALEEGHEPFPLPETKRIN